MGLEDRDWFREAHNEAEKLREENRKLLGGVLDTYNSMNCNNCKYRDFKCNNVNPRICYGYESDNKKHKSKDNHLVRNILITILIIAGVYIAYSNGIRIIMF